MTPEAPAEGASGAQKKEKKLRKKKTKPSEPQGYVRKRAELSPGMSKQQHIFDSRKLIQNDMKRVSTQKQRQLQDGPPIKLFNSKLLHDALERREIRVLYQESFQETIDKR